MNGSDQIEDRLRSALRAEADGLRLAPDPWQENQRRVAAATSRRSRRVLTVAAVVLALATMLGAVALLGGNEPGGMPAGGGPPPDPFSSEYLLGEPAELESPQIRGQLVTHRAALSDWTGSGPQLCDEYSGPNLGAGGCTARMKSADDRAIAFDWLSHHDVRSVDSNGQSAPESRVRGIVAGVDSRVVKVDIWLSNGELVAADLRPAGWSDTKLFGLTGFADAPVPQRLVAYGRDGNVLQTVDVAARFGDEWLTRRSACAGDRVAESVPDGDVLPNAYVALGTSDASISVRTSSDTSAQTCLDRLRGSALAGWFAPGDSELVVLVVGPEVERVAVSSPGTGTTRAEPQSLPGTPWKVAVVRARNGERFDNPAEAVAYDLHGLELDREFLAQPSSP